MAASFAALESSPFSFSVAVGLAFLGDCRGEK